MKAPRIYSDQPLDGQQVVELSDSAANHVGRVLRMKPQEPLVLFNGQGGQWLSSIESVSKKNVTVRLDTYRPDNAQSPLHTHLGQVLSRGERMDFAIQKATELGVSEITPLFSERCEVKLQADRIEKRLNHWRQIAISACEQCGRNILPVIHNPMKLEQWVSQQTTTLQFVLHHRTEKRLEGFDTPESVSLLIGPEGGLSAAEIELSAMKNFNPLMLGPRVLRTETAPLAALSLMQYLWGDG